MSIHIKDVNKRFGKFQALDNVNVDVPTGQLVALLGPSGSGKTTLLRIIAGLDVPDTGSVRIQDEDVTRRSARDRNIGFVFQHYALFRHMSVFENIAFALRVRRKPEGQVRDRVGELLRLIRLEGLGNRYPGQLSGGQRQRVALARALAAQPRLLLLDEPFGALDAKVRQELRDWLRRLHDEIHVTSLFVTHDQEEAFAVADRVVVMNQGRVEQVGAPHEVFDHPANAFVMDFLGNVNVFPARVQHGKVLLGDLDLSGVQTARRFGDPAAARDAETLTAAADTATLSTTVAELPPETSTARIYVRPHELEILAVPNGVPSLRAVVQHLNPTGPVTRVQLLAEDFGLVLQVEVSHERRRELSLQHGDRVYVSPRKVRVFPDYSI